MDKKLLTLPRRGIAQNELDSAMGEAFAPPPVFVKGDKR